MVRAGTHKCVLHAFVHGKPKPLITWQKDGVLKKSQSNIIIETTDKDTTLYIKDCSGSDSGVYSITASNACGEAKENIELVIQGIAI